MILDSGFEDTLMKILAKLGTEAKADRTVQCHCE